jgi:hypothetical protein
MVLRQYGETSFYVLPSFEEPCGEDLPPQFKEVFDTFFGYLSGDGSIATFMEELRREICIIVQSEGGEQGDVLMMLLYVVAQISKLAKVGELIRQRTQESVLTQAALRTTNGLSPLSTWLNMFYLCCSHVSPMT